jgi:hypothetical protein
VGTRQCPFCETRTCANENEYIERMKWYSSNVISHLVLESNKVAIALIPQFLAGALETDGFK